MSNMIVREQPTAQAHQVSRQSNIVYTPRFDVCEVDDAFILAGDMPGVAAEDIELRIENKSLSIWGKVSQRNEGVQYWAREYGVGDYYRTFQLGEDIDPSGIEAEVKNGVLTVRLPKRSEARPMRITVKES